MDMLDRFILIVFCLRMQFKHTDAVYLDESVSKMM